MSRRSGRAIETREEWDRICSVLRDHPRDLLLFQLVVQLGVPVQHLLQLKVRDLKDKKPGDRLSIPIPGTGQVHSEIIPEAGYLVCHRLLKKTGLVKDDYLFKSRKGKDPLTIQSVSRLVKKWFKNAGLEGFGGITSLHRTWERYFSQKSPEYSFASDMVPAGTSENIVREINVPSIQNAVYTELLRAIVSARICPGEKIVIDKIARQMNVSRIPVRAAMGRLEAKNLVYTRPNKGTFATRLSLEAMKELLEIRMLNEKLAAREAAVRRSDAAIRKLEVLHEQYQSAWHKNKLNGPIFEINRKFHFTIYREAAKPILLDIISFLWDRFSPYLYVLIDQTDVRGYQQDIRFHQGMIDGMRRRDPDAACKWLGEDIKDTSRILETYFKLLQFDRPHIPLEV